MVDNYVKQKKEGVYFANMLCHIDQQTVISCIDTCYAILSQNYSIKKNCKRFEAWKHKVVNNEKLSHPFSIYNDTRIIRNTHIIIVCTKKDDTLNGGNLLIYNDNKLENVLKLSSGSVLCINGNTFHSPQIMSGNGERNCIVLEFEKC